MPVIRLLPAARRAARNIAFTAAAGLGAAIMLAFGSPAHAQTVTAKPLPADHPLVGRWRVDLPGTNCFEMYQIGADGSTKVSSGRQEAEAVLDLALTQSPKGFYKWVEKVVKENGKLDCLGQRVAVGSVATNYIILNAPSSEFLMCQAEDINTCVGPFVRQPKDGS